MDAKMNNSIGQNHLNAFSKIYNHLYNSDINWVVTGSFAFAIQGIPVEVHDIDIQTDEKGAYQIEQGFSEFVTKNVIFSSGERIRSHFGALEIDGIKVEIMGDIQKMFDDGTWDNPVDLDHYKRFVNFNNMQIPVLSLPLPLDIPFPPQQFPLLFLAPAVRMPLYLVLSQDLGLPWQHKPSDTTYM